MPPDKLGMQQVFLQRAPCPGNAGLEVDQDVVKVNHPRRNQRPQGILAGGGIAAGAGHKTRRLRMSSR